MTGDMFRRADSKLTAYALGCGYVETVWRAGIHTTLYHEGCVYHVRQHDHNGGGRIFWDTFDTLAPARKQYADATR